MASREIAVRLPVAAELALAPCESRLGRYASRTALIVLAGLTAFLSLIAPPSSDSGGTATAATLPHFLQRALGPAQPSAALSNSPAPGVTVTIDRDGYRVVHEHASVSVAAEQGADGNWQRFANGASRATPEGVESIVLESRKVEQFLTIARHQGVRTWKWRLRAPSLTPRLGATGSVEFFDDAGVASLFIPPVAILNAEGDDITPAGLHWSLERTNSGWWLVLPLNDATLPLPYVIDPAITFRSSASAGNSGATSLVIPKPGGTLENDFLIAQVAVRGGTGTTITAPSGWSFLRRENRGTTIAQAIYYKVAGASEPGSYTWTFNGVRNASGGIIAYTGVNNTTPIDAQSGNTGNGTSLTALSVTTTVPDAMVVGFFGHARNTGLNAQTGMAERYQQDSGGGGADTRAKVLSADVTQASPGPTGNKTATAGQGADWVAHLVALRPAAKRTTDTSVSCTPASVAVGQSTSCTATVSATGPGTGSRPTGTVTFSLVTDPDGDAGGFVPLTCTLPTSGANECSVTYTPTAVGDGTHTVRADYGGDASHESSFGTFDLTVTKRTTDTSVSCTPASFRAGDSTSCTATVVDTVAGTAVAPLGTVTFTSNRTGTFTPTSCTLAPTLDPTDGPTSACAAPVGYTSTVAATHTITGNYGGDAIHKTSFGTTTVTVRPGLPANVTLSPAQDTNTAGDEHCVTATVTDAHGNAVEAGVAVYFSVTGANPRSATPVPTDSNGQAQFCYTGTKAGEDTITAVADRDDPPNGPDAGDPSGTAKKTYNPGPPAKVAVSPATATNPVRTQHCVTATVTDRFDNPVGAGIDVYFSVTGANPTSTAVKVATDGAGQAQFCYTGRNGGTDTIKAVADRDSPPNGPDPGDPFGTASKTWLSNIPCKVQGTGTISSTQQFNFGVEYFSGAAAPVGSATYIDSGQGKQFTSTRIDGLVCFGVSGGAHAIFFGRGLVNGVPVSDFQIDIDDLGPGPGTDKFAIQWPGYSAGGTLVTGDIQITLK